MTDHPKHQFKTNRVPFIWRGPVPKYWEQEERSRPTYSLITGHELTGGDGVLHGPWPSDHYDGDHKLARVPPMYSSLGIRNP